MGMGPVSLSAEAVCPRCEAIREDNALHHKNYQYYDDYEAEQKNVNTPSAPKAPNQVMIKKNSNNSSTTPASSSVDSALPVEKK